MMSGENKVSWTVKDLIPGGEYYFRVQAVNKIGGGEFIELRNPVIAEDQKRKQSSRMFWVWVIRSFSKFAFKCIKFLEWFCSHRCS